VRNQIALTGTILLGMWGMGSNEIAADDDKSPYREMETYRQSLVVESSADCGVPEAAAVYDGRRWALSTRWDDSHPNALNVRRKMLENGIRGTFYLNSRQPETQQGSLAFKLAGKGECSVGGHSATHPHLPKLLVNEAFYELMANRIALECLTDRPVNSLAFPYGGYQDKDRPEVLEGVTEAVLRTGYHHCVYAGFVMQNPFLPTGLVSTGLQVVPGDRQVDAAKFWTQIEKVRDSEARSRKTSDCIFLGVHPWQEGEELERLGDVMGELADWDDFWHCTQTEYAAFLKQRGNTTVEALGSGQFAIVRPCAFELGNDIPLTLVFDGNPVRSAKVDGVTCTVRQADGKTFVNVPHDSEQGVPRRIDEVSDGVSKKFPGLTASLAFEPRTGAITYTVKNGTDSTLSDLLLTVSTPPGFDPGMVRWKRAELAAGEEWTAKGTVTECRSGDYWHDGRYYAAGQLDFVLRGERGRVFAAWRNAP
jgi:peptidoglycan/xylan/chitin deacetylase (PgdA/CDA1 family)